MSVEQVRAEVIGAMQSIEVIEPSTLTDAAGVEGLSSLIDQLQILVATGTSQAHYAQVNTLPLLRIQVTSSRERASKAETTLSDLALGTNNSQLNKACEAVTATANDSANLVIAELELTDGVERLEEAWNQVATALEAVQERHRRLTAHAGFAGHYSLSAIDAAHNFVREL